MSGSGKAATRHFKNQRFTAILLVPLVVWFVVTIAMQSGASHSEMTAFLKDPINAALMALCCVTGFLHFALGLEVVIDDYITGKALNAFCHLANKLFMFLGLAASIAALVVIHF